MLHNWDELSLSRSEVSLCGSYLHVTSNMPLQELEWSWPKVCLHALWTAPQGFGKGFFSSASILNFMLAPRIAPWETGVHGTFAACLVALAQPPGSEVLLNRWSFVSNDQCWMLKPLWPYVTFVSHWQCYFAIAGAIGTKAIYWYLWLLAIFVASHLSPIIPHLSPHHPWPRQMAVLSVLLSLRRIHAVPVVTVFWLELGEKSWN